jgi:hypothetical protein
MNRYKLHEPVVRREYLGESLYRGQKFHKKNVSSPLADDIEITDLIADYIHYKVIGDKKAVTNKMPIRLLSEAYE